MQACLCTNQALKLTNDTKTDVSTGVCLIRMVTQHQGCHCAAPEDKQINEMLQSDNSFPSDTICQMMKNIVIYSNRRKNSEKIFRRMLYNIQNIANKLFCFCRTVNFLKNFRILNCVRFHTTSLTYLKETLKNHPLIYMIDFADA